MASLERRLGPGLLAAVMVAGAFTTVEACSSDKPRASSSSSGDVPDATDDPGPIDHDSGIDGGSDSPFGDLPTVDDPGLPCVATTAKATTLFGAGDAGFGGPPVSVVQPLGGGRFGRSPNG